MVGKAAKGVTNRVQKWESLSKLFVEDRAKNGDGEVGELRSTFVKLQPADDAMVEKIFGDARLGDAEVIGEQGSQIGIPAARGAGARERADRYAQSVASLYMIGGSHVVVGENEDTRPGWSVLRVIKFCRGTGEQTPELHFEKAESRRKARVAETSFDAGCRRIRQRFDGNPRDGSRID